MSFSLLESELHRPSLLKSKAEVRAKLRDSLLYHVHYNSIKPVLPGFSQFQTNWSGGCKALTALLGNFHWDADVMHQVTMMAKVTIVVFVLS